MTGATQSELCHTEHFLDVERAFVADVRRPALFSGAAADAPGDDAGADDRRQRRLHEQDESQDQDAHETTLACRCAARKATKREPRP